MRERKGEDWEMRKEKPMALTSRHALIPQLLLPVAQLYREQLEDMAELWEKRGRALGLDGMGFPGYICLIPGPICEQFTLLTIFSCDWLIKILFCNLDGIRTNQNKQTSKQPDTYSLCNSANSDSKPIHWTGIP